MNDITEWFKLKIVGLENEERNRWKIKDLIIKTNEIQVFLN